MKNKNKKLKRILYGIIVILFIALVALGFFHYQLSVHTEKEYQKTLRWIEYANNTKSELNQLKTDYNNLEEEHKELNIYHNRLQSNYKSLDIKYDNIINDYNELVDGYNNLAKIGVFPPYITIYNQTVYTSFILPNNETIEWTTPFSTMEHDLFRGFYERNFNVKYIKLRNDDGEIFEIMDFTSYVDGSSFEDVIGEMYNDYSNDEEFIYDLWYMVAQLTTYSYENEETPKFPYETLLSGGGDCEDTAILLASMLKAVPQDWEVNLVDMDADNPTDPQDVNHVIVYVDTGEMQLYIETTSDTDMTPYDKVEGWHYELN